MHELKIAVGDDFYAIEVPYQSPAATAIFAAFDWYMDGNVDARDRTLTADGCFKDAQEVEDLAFFEWPNPEKYIDVEECRRRASAAPKDKTRLGMLWSAHFQDACASFGMETALMNMILNPEVYRAVDNKIVEFYLKANEIFYEATKGQLDAVLIGNDMGSQRGPMLSPEMVRNFVIPGCKKLVEQAHSYGLKVIYHSCGSIVDIIPDLIEAGVDTQDLLVNGTSEEVRAKVRELRRIFPTGLVISPSHEAVMADVPPENIHALFDEAGKIYE